METTRDLIAVITAVGALIGSLSAGAVQWGLQAAAKRKALAEAAGAEVGVSATLFAEWKKIVEELREEVRRLTAARAEAESRLEAAEGRERELEKHLRQARQDISDLKNVVRQLRAKPAPG